MLARLDELGLLKSIHPNLIWDDWFKAKMTMIGYEKPINHWLFDQVDWRNQPWDIIRRSLLYGLWFIRMGEDQVKSVGNRIKHPSGHIQEIILAATVCKEIPGLVEKSRSHIATVLSEFNPSTMALVYFTLDKDSDKKLIREYITEIRYIRPHVNGSDLRAQGLPPGPAYKQILAELRDGWLDGNITNANQEKEMLDQLIARELGSKK